jgi:hypothetical protein
MGHLATLAPLWPLYPFLQVVPHHSSCPGGYHHVRQGLHDKLRPLYASGAFCLTSWQSQPRIWELNVAHRRTSEVFMVSVNW